MFMTRCPFEELLSGAGFARRSIEAPTIVIRPNQSPHSVVPIDLELGFAHLRLARLVEEILETPFDPSPDCGDHP